MFDTAFLALMASRPQLLPEGTTGQYGKRVYGSPVTMTAYWVAGSSSSTDGTSNRTGTLYVAPAAYWDTPYTREPTVDDGLLLPDGTDATIIKVTVYRDQDGAVAGSELEYA